MATKESLGAAWDEAYEHYKEYAENGKKEYDAIYHRMMEKISAEDIKRFADIFLEHEQYEINTELALSSLKTDMLDKIFASWNDVWEGSLRDGIIKLEMLKEHYKEFKDIDWNIGDMTIEERLLPYRMKYKQVRLRWLQNEVNIQNKLLKKKIEDIEERRLFIQRVSDEAIQLTEHLGNYCDSSVQIQELKKEFKSLLHYQDEI